MEIKTFLVVETEYSKYVTVKYSDKSEITFEVDENFIKNIRNLVVTQAKIEIVKRAEIINNNQVNN